MSEISVGPPQSDDELLAFAAQHRRTYNWTQEAYDDWVAKRAERVEDLRIVRSGDRVAGGLSLIPMGQWFGGRSIPMTGIGGVGVDPQERAGGLASALMRSVVEELHAGGTALSALYPATQPVYRRVGYELAGSFVNYSVAANLIDSRDRSLQIEVCDPVDRDLLSRLYVARAQRTNANLDRSEKFWNRITDNPKGDVHTYVVSGDSGAEGYIVFRQLSEKGWGYDLNLRDVVALTPGAGRRLWTFFADHRSFAGKVKWIGGPADPFTFHLREQDWAVDKSWNWMLRIVDVERALGERGYPSGLEAELHLDVADDIVPANNTSFVLRVAGGKGEVARGGRGSVKIDVRGLAPMYAGFLGAEELTATGYIDGPDEDLAIATAIFGGPAPWLADFF
jgi:predicted acetyltransferase